MVKGDLGRGIEADGFLLCRRDPMHEHIGPLRLGDQVLVEPRVMAVDKDMPRVFDAESIRGRMNSPWSALIAMIFSPPR